MNLQKSGSVIRVIPALPDGQKADISQFSKAEKNALEKATSGKRVGGHNKIPSFCFLNGRIVAQDELQSTQPRQRILTAQVEPSIFSGLVTQNAPPKEEKTADDFARWEETKDE